ncbi:hypothetical protein BZG13_06240 [Salinivibrio sp. ML323]|nr:hypothetical protein BZG13_06240 [Salinivibrio sp. ML323]OOE66053.1 hypothetical protein BZG14_05660 [Salinivibrio sp. IB282]
MSEGNTTVAVALIVKNEAHNIDLCLQSVCNWVDEIVVLDAGSSDNTTEIAKQYTDKVYVASDWRGFGKQRQRAQSPQHVIWSMSTKAERFIGHCSSAYYTMCLIS